MPYLGDVRPSMILDTSFVTAGSGGVPASLTGGAISIYKDNSTAESTAGVTLSADFDARTGYNHLRIDLSADTAFYVSGSQYRAVITAGTVGGVSAVGYVVAEFSIHARGAQRVQRIEATRKAATALGAAPNKKIRFQLYRAGGGGFLNNADVTLAAGDVTVGKDNGAQANVATLPSYNNGAWELELSGTELTAALAYVRIADAAPKVFDDVEIVIETVGAGGMYPDDVFTASAATPSNFSSLLIDGAGRVELDATSRAAIVTSIDASSTQLASLITLAGALSTSVNNLNNLSALANMLAPSVMEVPASGTRVYLCRLTVKDTEGHLVDLDALPTLVAVNAAGTDRSANLSAASRASLGVYNFTYTLAAGAAEEGLIVSATGAVATSARRADAAISVVSVDTASSLASILTRLGAPSTGSISSDIAAVVTGAAANNTAIMNRVGAPAGASIAADIAALAAVSPPTAAQIADGVLARNAKGGSNGPANQSVAAALAGGFMNFAIDVPTSTLTVRYADGTTAFTRTLARAAVDAIIAAV